MQGGVISGLNKMRGIFRRAPEVGTHRQSPPLVIGTARPLLVAGCWLAFLLGDLSGSRRFIKKNNFISLCCCAQSCIVPSNTRDEKSHGDQLLCMEGNEVQKELAAARVSGAYMEKGRRAKTIQNTGGEPRPTSPKRAALSISQVKVITPVAKSTTHVMFAGLDVPLPLDSAAKQEASEAAAPAGSWRCPSCGMLRAGM